MIVCEIYKINTDTNGFEHNIFVDGKIAVDSNALDDKIFDRLEKLGSAYHNGMGKYDERRNS